MAEHHWQAIRRRRLAQGIPEENPDRRRTFQSALEQAEQQFRAARQIGVESRPLNLYYGLAQAGRAIAAAAHTLTGDDYVLDGRHGIAEVRTKGGPLFEGAIADFPLKVPEPGKGAFGQLSALLDSDQPDRLTIGDAWASIYELVTNAPLDDSPVKSLPIEIEPSAQRSRPGGPLDVHRAFLELPPIVRETYDRAQVVEYLNRFPALRGFSQQSQRWRGQTFPLRLARPSPLGVGLEWVIPELLTTNHRHVLSGRVALEGTLAVITPAVDGRDKTFHPLMAWWAVLFGTSILARYNPASWTAFVDVDVNLNAVPLEVMLGRAIDTLPALINHTMDQVGYRMTTPLI